MKESPVVKACLQLLTLAGIFAWRNNTGAVCATYKGRKRFIRYGHPGSPDILAILPGGRLCGIECKKPLGPRGGKNGSEQTPEQVAFEYALKRSGAEYLLIRSGKDLELQLRNWGIL